MNDPTMQRLHSKRRRWLFRFFALLFPFLCLFFVEVCLRVAGFPYETPLFVQTSEREQWQVNAAAETPYFQRHGLAGPEDRPFDLPASESTFRIVVLGASTVQGFPYASEIAFPRQLEYLVNYQLQQAEDSRRIEVLNLGITAINSFSLVDMAARCMQCQPDLIVLYAGHNEFYGPGGAATTVRGVPQSMYSLSLAARKTATYQACYRWMNSKREPNSDSPIDSLPESLQIRYESPQYQDAEFYYEQNLRKISRICETHEVPLLLCTVIGNLKDHSPTSFLLPDDSTAVDPNWRKIFDEGRALAGTGDFSGALEKLNFAETIFSDSSLLHFRKGKCLLRLGKIEEAVAAYSRARDLDGSRFRAPASFREIVLRVANSSENNTVVDLEQYLRTSKNPLPGLDLFLEHVHPNLKGHRMIASEIGQIVCSRYLTLAAPWISPAAADWEQGMGILPIDKLAGLSLTFDVLNSNTMSQSFDNQKHLSALGQQMKEEYEQMPQQYRSFFADLSTAQMSADLIGNFLRMIGTKNAELHDEVLEAGKKRAPWKFLEWDAATQNL